MKAWIGSGDLVSRAQWAQVGKGNDEVMKGINLGCSGCSGFCYIGQGGYVHRVKVLKGHGNIDKRTKELSMVQ